MTACDRWPGCGCGTQSGPHTCEGRADVLALDVATTSGWARGRVGDERPSSGSLRFASPNASQAAIFAACFDWFVELTAHDLPDVIVIEDLMPFRASIGKTNRSTGDLLGGLQAIIRTVAFKRNIFKVRAVSVVDVRQHFLGCNPKRDRAKRQVVQRCRELGWLEHDDADAGDAIAAWSYWCSRIDPSLALRVSPLFLKRPAKVSA